MRRFGLLLLAGAIGTVAVPSIAYWGGGGRSAWVRDYAAWYALHAAKIPAWARKYNMNCSGCHYPAAPRLNATGIRFRWAGYRMPDEIGEQTNVAQLSNYIALRGRARYEFSKTESQPVSTSAFTFNDATLFYAGALGKNFAGFTELEREPSGEVELVANMIGVWGKEQSFRGFRVGQMHWLLRDGVAGFDRPTGVRTPNPLNNAVTAGVPFRFSADQLGFEWFMVNGRNRVSAEVLNGVGATGSGDPPDPDTEKDFAVTDQYLFDDLGSGLTAVAYFGTVKGLDTAISTTLRSHFTRFSISANKIVNRLEVVGGFVYGKDQDLPGATTEVTGMGYWVYGGYMLPKSSLTLFGRYEFVDPNTDVTNNGSTRLVGGLVLPIGLPEYLRFALEGALDLPQAAASLNKTGITAELMLNF